MFELDQVSMSFGELAAIGSLTLRCEPGTTTALIGPSGCGKSTLLRLMIGLLAPTRGRVLFDGQPLSAETLGQLRRRTGYVIQDGGLFPHMTAAENVTLMAPYLGWAASQTQARLAQLCELTRFPADALARYPGELSGGQKQRVALMRALLADPEALLLDEPLGALDPMIRFELQEDLARIFADLGKTVVLVTHDLAEAAFLAHRIVLLRDGDLVQSGTLEEMLADPASEFVERFVRAQRSHGIGEHQ
ncbi:MAG: ATP-binding cassette domain-containing protein [Gammaproteobacteria bacterium]|nr:ATP-binding cassette domain-containing protein [Gammaproteobacteria bacterium]